MCPLSASNMKAADEKAALGACTRIVEQAAKLCEDAGHVHMGVLTRIERMVGCLPKREEPVSTQPPQAELAQIAQHLDTIRQFVADIAAAVAQL